MCHFIIIKLHQEPTQNCEPNPTGKVPVTLNSNRLFAILALGVLLSNKKSLIKIRNGECAENGNKK